MKATPIEKERMKRYYQKNRKRLISNQRLYRNNHLEECRKRNKEYAKRNKSKVAILTRNWVQRKRESIIQGKLGGKCIRCGNDDIRVLEVNHKEVKTKRGRRDWYTRGFDLRKVELLCANCHRIEHYEFQKTKGLKHV